MFFTPTPMVLRFPQKSTATLMGDIISGILHFRLSFLRMIFFFLPGDSGAVAHAPVWLVGSHYRNVATTITMLVYYVKSTGGDSLLLSSRGCNP
jgi:hypothetical protein